MSEMHHHRLQQQLLLARMDERKHIARELHDQVIQDLVGLQYQLSAAHACAEPVHAQQLTRMQEQVCRLIHKTRQLCGHIRSTPASGNMQRGEDLARTARTWIELFAATCALRLTVHVEGGTDDLIDPDAALCMFRVLQEALINIHKHAHAQVAIVDMHIRADALALRVEDDGIGFCPATCIEQGYFQNHFGIIGMRERLERMEGNFEVRSAVGQGTTILAWVPCRHPLYQELSREAEYATV